MSRLMYLKKQNKIVFFFVRRASVPAHTVTLTGRGGGKEGYCVPDSVGLRTDIFCGRELGDMKSSRVYGIVRELARDRAREWYNRRVDIPAPTEREGLGKRLREILLGDTGVNLGVAQIPYKSPADDCCVPQYFEGRLSSFQSTCHNKNGIAGLQLAGRHAPRDKMRARRPQQVLVESPT